MAFLDPPYNVKIAGVVGRGRTKHAEFAEAYGDKAPEPYETLDPFGTKGVELIERIGAHALDG